MSDEDMYTGYAYAAITKRANRTSVLGRRFITTDVNPKYAAQNKDDELALIHPYLKVINRSKEYSKKRFWYEISTYLDLEGVYYLGVVRNFKPKSDGGTKYGAVQKFVLINPYQVRTVKKEATGEIGGYVEAKNGFYREWAPEQIIEIRMLNPFDQDKPFAMTDAAKESQFTMKQAGDYTRQTINGNIASPGIVSTAVELDPEQFANFRERVTNRTKGEPIFANGSGSINWQDMQIDLDRAALDKINEIQRAILFAVSGTSKTVLGIEESGTTRDTSETQDDNFTVDAIIPRVEDIADALNLDYRRAYPEWENNEFEIVVNSPIETDRDTELKNTEIRTKQLELANALVGAGYEAELATKYATGEISLEQLGQPTLQDELTDAEAESIAAAELGIVREAVEPTGTSDKKQTTDESITRKEEDTNEPKKQGANNE